MSDPFEDGLTDGPTAPGLAIARDFLAELRALGDQAAGAAPAVAAPEMGSSAAQLDALDGLTVEKVPPATPAREPWHAHIPRLFFQHGDMDWPDDLTSPNDGVGYTTRHGELKSALTSMPWQYMGRGLTPEEHDEVVIQLRETADDRIYGERAERRAYLHALADSAERHGAKAMKMAMPVAAPTPASALPEVPAAAAEPAVAPAPRGDSFSLGAVRRKASAIIRSMVTGEDPNEAPKRGRLADSIKEKLEAKGAAADGAPGEDTADSEEARVAEKQGRIRDTYYEEQVKLQASWQPFIDRLEKAEAKSRAAEADPNNLGILGELGLLTKEEQQAWLKGERIAADRSLAARKEGKRKADEAAAIFEKGAPGKPMHPWIKDRQAFQDKALAEAETRQRKVEEMEAGTRAPAKKAGWRAAIENTTAGIAAGGTKITMLAELEGEVERAIMEGSGGPAEMPTPISDTVLRLGKVIAAKAEELFPGDPARQHEVSQVLAKRTAQFMGGVGALAASAAAKRKAQALWKERRNRKKTLTVSSD
jgi:hypothetical protein